MPYIPKISGKDLQYLHTVYVFRHAGADYNVIFDYSDNLIIIDMGGVILNTSPRGNKQSFRDAKQHLVEYINL